MSFNPKIADRFHLTMSRSWWVVLAALLASTSIFAQGTVGSTGAQVSGLTASDMLTNIANQIPNVMRMVTAIAYVLGMYFIIYALMKLKEFGEARTMMSSQHHLKGPLIYLAVGTLLLYLPSAVQSGLTTFWTNPNPYEYEENTSQYAGVMSNALVVVQLFGTIAFIRGLVILSHAGEQHGGGQNSVGKGLTHIIGGVFCINIYQFVQMVFATLGISVS